MASELGGKGIKIKIKIKSKIKSKRIQLFCFTWLKC